MLTRVSGAIFIALAACLFATNANAQAQRVGVCLESINPNTGANQCNDGWATVILNGMKTTATQIKATSGALGKIYCYNPNSSVAYAQIYNATSTATETALLAGTQAPAQSFGIGQTSGQEILMPSPGDWFGTAISIAVATTATGNTQPTTAVDCNASYE